MNVWLAADTAGYPEGGGHFWAYLNWALGLRSVGCDVVWLEGARPNALSLLRDRLEPFGLADSVALWRSDGSIDFDAGGDADLLLNLRYTTPVDVVARFPRTALVDIDPGLLQSWLRLGQIDLPAHDAYFSVGERTHELDPARHWMPVRRCVDLDWWRPRAQDRGAPYTTVTHWSAEEWLELDDGVRRNDKRSGFLPFLELPRYVTAPLELAVLLGRDEHDEREQLSARGWRVVDPVEVAATPWSFAGYVEGSRGEFSCAKPSAVFFQNAWISDRTVCYLAAGKPAIVQHTGASEVLPEDAGLWRFRTIAEAAAAVEAVEADYDRQSSLARGLAEELFDARRVVTGLLEQAL